MGHVARVDRSEVFLCVIFRLSMKTYIVVKVRIELFLNSNWLQVGCQHHDLSIFTPERILF